MLKLVLVFTLFIFYSCVPKTSTNGSRASLQKNGTSAAITPTATPNFTNIVNYFQQGITQSTSILSLASNFTDSFMIRGNQVHNYYAAAVNSSSVLCMVAQFPSNPNNKLFVVAAIPQSFNNLSTGVKEYYLQLQPTEKSINQVNCQTSSLVTSMLTLYPTLTPVFKLSEVCPSCSTTLTSNGLKIYTTNGVALNSGSIDISGLRLQIGLSGNTTANSGGSCQNTSNCVALGFDCCLSGQCVLDGRTRDGVTVPTSVLTEVANNPSTFKNYPQYYYICSSVVPTPTPTPAVSDNTAEVQALLRLQHLEDLYNCIKSGTDEMNICTYQQENIKAAVIAAGATGAFYTVPTDDLNFKTINTLMANDNVTEVIYAGETLYTQSPLYQNTARFGFLSGTYNDTLSSGETVKIIGAPSTTATNDILKVRYKIDGSCEKLNTSLARCKKTYFQGQLSTPAKVSDHVTGDQQFKLPSYFDPTYAIIVKVNDLVIPESATTWSLSGSTITFIGSSQVYYGQKVEVTYYASNANVPLLTTSKYSAQTEVNLICTQSSNNSCGNGNCSLNPTYQLVNGVQTVTDYVCVYPQPTLPDPPMQQVVYVSSKTVPHRYFDQNGVAYDTVTSNTPSQEGNAFAYTNGNLFKPNNLTIAGGYLGINEVLGSMNPLDVNSSQPAKMVALKKGKQYDIWVDSGVYSPCPNCGNDYYSSLQKLFPQSFQYQGAGLRPSLYENSRRENKSSIRSDEMLFGRACYVPVTMIPWSHVANSSSIQLQRQNRLRAQHFLFANGYQRDWYGFDFGSLIGSYDGVTWFSVGNQRRTTAQTSKLYLAVNGHFGDLTTNNNFSVTISEVTNVGSGGSTVTNDTLSDGAECQRHHYCTTDNDCVTKLGYEYSCQTVSGISTSWPAFNSNGEELIGVSNAKTIASVISGLNGPSKRCVYRGRGAPCSRDYGVIASSSLTNNYAQSSQEGLHACNSNNYCEVLTSSKFNNKIARYGKSPASVNTDTAGTTDTFGMAAKVLGRPLDFNATNSVESSITLPQLATNNLTAICIPGREVTAATTLVNQNKAVPSTRNGDKILGLGTTPTGTSPLAEYVSQCPVMDTTGNFLHTQSSYYGLASNSSTVTALAATQNIPVNSMKMTTTYISNVASSLELLTPSSGIIEKLGFQENTCLRAPGASCQTELDCAPSKYIAGKFASITAENFQPFSSAELKFWQEGLICSQDQDPVQDVLTYDMKNNRCCRETGKKLTTYSQYYWDDDVSTSVQQIIDVTGIPLATTSLNSSTRYSRMSTAYYKMQTTPSDYPALYSYKKDTLASILSGKHYNTLDEINTKACCTKNWIRSFHKENGGGHKWLQGKLQNIDKGVFKYVSWYPQSSTDLATPIFKCDTAPAATNNITSPGCEIRNFSTPDEAFYLDFFGRFELTGIPQIGIDYGVNHLATTTSTQGTPSPSAVNFPDDPTGTGRLINSAAYNKDATGVIFTSSSPHEYVNGSDYGYAANDKANFSSKIKQVFSDGEFNCCIPSTKENLPDTVTDEMCCTGYKRNDEKRCCLPDFTDVSVYFNRYVSSEGSGLSSSSYDSTTGYIKDKAVVLFLAQSKSSKGICCSGQAPVYGRAINKFKVPGAENATGANATPRRFVYNNNPSDDFAETGYAAQSYDAGVRWNNHLYCVPSGFPTVP